MNSTRSRLLAIVVSTVISCFAATSFGQDDPATQTNVMEETLKTIKEVENLNQYLAENKSLRSENKQLKGQLASLTKQIQQLTNQIKTSNETLRKQLLTLPQFEVKSKMVSASSAVAVLDMGGKLVRIRDKVEMSVPVQNGVWTLMRVEKITKDVIELKFLELDRTVTIYN